MGRICAVRNCLNDHRRVEFLKKSENKIVHFFKFPKDKQIFSEWVKACGYTNSHDVYRKSKSKRLLVCSEHFADSDFSKAFPIKSGDKRRNRIKKYTIPTKNLPVAHTNILDEKSNVLPYERLLAMDVIIADTEDNKDDSSNVTENETRTIEEEEHSEEDLDEMSDYNNFKETLNNSYNSPHFTKLCRVCGKTDEEESIFELISKYEKQMVKTLKKCFSIVVTKFDDPNWKICINCKLYLQSLTAFCDHVDKVQQMIEVIKDLSIENIPFKIDEVRKNHGILSTNKQLYLIENLEETKSNQKDAKQTIESINIENVDVADNSLVTHKSHSSKNYFDFNTDENLFVDSKVCESNDGSNEMLDDEKNVVFEYNKDKNSSENDFDSYSINEEIKIERTNDFKNIEENDIDLIEGNFNDSSTDDGESGENNGADDLIDNENGEMRDPQKTLKIKKRKGVTSSRRNYSNWNKNKRFECEICFQKCYGARRFFLHKFKVHNIIPPEKKLDQEEAKKNLKYCEICDQNFYHEYILTTHYEMCHNIKREIICDYCGEKFNTTIKLNFHLRKHLPKEELLKISEFECSYCQKKFLNKYSLRTHIKGYHEISKDYICEVCGKSFTCSNYLCLHRRHEHVENPTECPTCKKVFKNFSHMRNHQHVVHGLIKKKYPKVPRERPFHCSFCQKSYRTIEAFNVHMVKHTNTKPFKCRVCGKGFTAPSHCKKHVKVVHRNEPTENCYIGEIPSFEEIKSMLGDDYLFTMETTECKLELSECEEDIQDVIESLVQESEKDKEEDILDEQLCFK